MNSNILNLNDELLIRKYECNINPLKKHHFKYVQKHFQ
jgi:hypothetical protein